MSLLSKIPGIQFGFGNARFPTHGLDLPSLGAPHEVLPQHRQVHGTRLAWRGADSLKGVEADAIASALPNVVVGVRTADCVPILLSRRDARAVAAIHAGWRGTVARITDLTLEALAKEHGPMSDWVASIGPHIGPCCYQVGDEVLSAVTEAFPGLSPAVFEPRPRMLSLQAFHLYSLRRQGVGEIETTSECTHCSKLSDANGLEQFKFFSYRRDATLGRQWSFIQILP
jgi:YfiH family protein